MSLFTPNYLCGVVMQINIPPAQNEMAFYYLATDAIVCGLEETKRVKVS